LTNDAAADPLTADDDAPIGSEQLWSACHKPLLQCMAALCADRRRHVRQWALTMLSVRFI